MARAAVIWAEEGQLRWSELHEGGDNIISRSPDTDIVLNDPAVSRSPHAAIHSEGGRFIVEQLRTDRQAIRVNGQTVATATPLADGDTVMVGSTQLTVHDLAAGDTRSSYVTCSTCGHRNETNRTECWYDGENLANAQSVIYQVSPVLCRALLAGEPHDLSAGDVLSIHADGSVHLNSVAADEGLAAAQIRAEDGGVTLRATDGAPCRVNRQPASGAVTLRTGDMVEVGPAVVLTIVR